MHPGADEAAGRLEVHGLTVSYGRRPALRGVDLHAGPGELLGVVGPNGAGKSTLLKAVVGLVPVAAGRVEVDGSPAGDALRDVAFLPQLSTLDWDFPAVVRDVVAMGRAPHLGRWRRPGPDDRALVAAAIDRLGLSGLAHRPMSQLSGGQRQRTLLARALAQEAKLLLLDEPFAGVDAVTERLIWAELIKLAREGRTVVLVNHDLVGVLEHCDTLLLLAGRVVAWGPPQHVGTPENLLRAYGGLPLRQAADPPARGGVAEPPELRP